MKFGLNLFWVVTFCVGLSVSTVAQTNLPTGHNPNSEYSIRYEDWDLILSSTVLDVGPSDRRTAGRLLRHSGTSKIKKGNQSATAFEGNRVLFSEFSDEHVESLLAIRKDLEAVPDFIPLEDFDQWDQLAYWYNLHNVAVMYEIAKAYPIKKIKPLMEGRKAVWDNKTMSVAGVPTSIRDIEKHVVTNWDNPLVLYGFFMGTVGGPNVITTAYTGDNVVERLQKNAVRFVNSLRGFRMWSGTARVSEHYKIGEHLFPNFEEDLMQHLLAYARPDTRRELAKAKAVKIKNYDWGIADLKDGSVYQGTMFNTNPGALAWFIETPNPQANAFGNPNGFTGDINANMTPFGALDDAATSSAAITGPVSAKLAPQTKVLLRAMKMRNERRLRQGEVTVEEFVGDADDGSRVVRRKSLEETVEAGREGDEGQLTE